ncbi:hypothetical protein [Devosia ginsengisoli]|uniref:hypothetical protein n=1 Tax=Devosia ginsengisoli TaxID=400770 RepID=UPI0026ECD965|nr:hypothetical protein [Devosia ginsengisoli]MCR6672037.1 hypothetical protein [Devosia ginsengisoli]
MPNNRTVLNGDFLEIVLILAKSWKLIVFGPLLCMAATAALIYAQPRPVPTASAKVMAEPQAIAHLAEPAGIRNLLTTDANVEPDAADIADAAALRIIPEPEQIYRLELQNADPERAVGLLSALVDGLVREAAMAPDDNRSKRDIILEKLEIALATVDRSGAENDPVIRALVDAFSYILTEPSTTKAETSVPIGAAVVTEAPQVPRPPGTRSHILITLFVGCASAAAFITLALFWSWMATIATRPENTEKLRAIRAALPGFRGPRGS